MLTDAVAQSLVDMDQFPQVTGYIFVANDVLSMAANGAIEINELVLFYEGGRRCVTYPVQLGDEMEAEIRRELRDGNSVEIEGWEVDCDEGNVVIVESVVAVSPRGEERGLMWQNWERN